jgi:hypothetical protein
VGFCPKDRRTFPSSWIVIVPTNEDENVHVAKIRYHVISQPKAIYNIHNSVNGLPSPSLSNRAKCSLNSAICSAVSWSAMVIVA